MISGGMFGFRYAAAGSPGARFSTKNTSVAIPSRSGIAPSTRRRMKVPIRVLAAQRPVANCLELSTRVHLDTAQLVAHSGQLVQPEHERHGLLPLEDARELEIGRAHV